MKRLGRTMLIAIVASGLISGIIATGVSFIIVRKASAPSTKTKASAKKSGNEKEKAKTVSFLYTIGELTVNLKEPGRYLRIGLELEIEAKATSNSKHQSEPTSTDGGGGHGGGHSGSDKNEPPLPPGAKVTKHELDELRSKILDAINEQLASSSFKEILTPQGRLEMRQRLQKTINGLLKTGKVKEIYFTTFLAQ